MVTFVSLIAHSISDHMHDVREVADSAVAGIRYQLLRALNMLALGHHIYVMSPSAWDIHLQGCPHVSSLLKFLVDTKLVEEATSKHWAGGFTLRLSDRGADYLAEGMKWWDSLPRVRKILLIITE